VKITLLVALGLQVVVLLSPKILFHDAQYQDSSFDYGIMTHTSTISTTTMMMEDEWYRKYLEDYEYCSNNNYVVYRYAKGNNFQKHVPSEEAARPFSLPKQAFGRFHSRYCESVSEVLSAVQGGARVWVNTTVHSMSLTKREEFLVKEQHPSYFVPANCQLPVLNGHQICVRLQQFSHVAFLGDSLQRQVYQALVSSIQPDFQRGWTHLSPDETTRRYCYCDGQYSEHLTCRKADIPAMYHNLSLLASFCEQHGTGNWDAKPVATSYMHEIMAPKRLYSGYNDLAHFDCSASQLDRRDLLLVLEGGLWFESQAHPTFQKLRSILKLPNILECARQRRLLVIWCSYNYNSPTVHEKYPHQSPANGTIFNKHMESLLRAMSSNVAIVNWINMTKAAQVSDGLHFLTDVNYFKAQHILLLADEMQQEKKYYCDKEEDDKCK
jgi:hypothetical protein